MAIPKTPPRRDCAISQHGRFGKSDHAWWHQQDDSVGELRTAMEPRRCENVPAMWTLGCRGLPSF